MKLIKKLFLILVIGLTFSLFTGCMKLAKAENNVSVIEDTIPEEITVGDFDLSAIWLQVEFDNGTSGMIACDESMLVNYKLDHYLVPGEQFIRVKYHDCIVDFTVNLLEKYPDVNVNFVFGEEVLSSKTVEKHTSIGELPTAEVAGYRFDGWYLESFFKTLATPESVADGDTTIYGKFTPITYKVTFMYGDNTLEEGVIYKDCIYYFPPAQMTGKTFVGWFTSDGTEVTDKTVITGDLTVIAKFE